MWKRTCQECGHQQPDKRPEGAPTDAYCNRKCKHCKSIGLDYGTEYNEEPEHNANSEHIASSLG